ncbi:MAG: ATP synthase F1 subunit gamma [Limnochordales bacterium]
MAGQSMRDIKRRINSVKNIQHITKAMELVSATKLRRSQQNVERARPYAQKLQEVLGRLLAANRPEDGRKPQHPLLVARPIEKVCYVLVTSDRGLAGAYNANVIRLAEQTFAAEQRPYKIITIGRKGAEYFLRRRYPIFRDYEGIGDEVHYHQAQQLANELVEMFTSGDVDGVRFIYTRFISTGTQRPNVAELLPLTKLASEEGGQRLAGETPAEEREYIYEPSPQAVLGLLLPRYVEWMVFTMLSEAKASEHAARMRAMRSASDNAGEMIRTLTLSFNRARQAAITKEIAEIVSGAEALQGAGW